MITAVADKLKSSGGANLNKSVRARGAREIFAPPLRGGGKNISGVGKFHFAPTFELIYIFIDMHFPT